MTKWELERMQLAMAVLRRTTKDITPVECAARMTTVLNNVYLQGKIDQIQIDIEKMEEKKP